MIACLNINASIFNDNATTAYSPLLASGLAIGNPGRTIQSQLGMGFNSQVMSTFTTNYMIMMRQQMDESNHDMVNMLTRQMGTIFNHLIQNTNKSYQQLATQINRIAYFFRAPHAQIQPTVQPIWSGWFKTWEYPLKKIQLISANNFFHVVEQEMPREGDRFLVLVVNRNQDVD